VELTPAVAIPRSVPNDHIVCLDDGKKLKMLKRHPMTDHGLTPEQYRARWDLKPMILPEHRPSTESACGSIAGGTVFQKGGSGVDCPLKHAKFS